MDPLILSHERVRLIRNDIYRSIIKSTHQMPYSLTDFHNHLMALIQVPFSIVLYKTSDQNFECPLHTIRDEKYKRILERSLNKWKKNSYFHKELLYLFPSEVGENFRVLPIAIIDEIPGERDDKNFFIPIFKSKLNSGNKKRADTLKSYIFSALADIFDIKTSVTQWRTYYSNYISNLTEMLNTEFSKPKAIAKSSPFVTDNQFQSAALSAEYWRELVSFSINGIYNNLSDQLEKISDLLSEHKKLSLPNAFFAIRYFTRKNIRADKFEYNVAFILTERLKNQMDAVLKNINAQIGTEFDYEKIITFWKKTFGCRVYKDLYNDALGNSSGPSICAQLDEIFWRRLLQDAPKFSFENIFSTEVGDGVRSFADSIFMSGITQIKASFARGGLRRVLSEEEIRNGIDLQIFEKQYPDRFNDLLRVVSVYYILCLMSPNRNETQDINIILSPIKVCGGTWAVSGHVFSDENALSDLESFGYINSSKWGAIQHLMLSVQPVLNEHVQLSLRDLHLMQIEQYSALSLGKLIPGIENSSASSKGKSKNLLQTAIVEFNAYSKGFERFSPFPRIELVQFNADADIPAHFSVVWHLETQLKQIIIAAQFKANVHFRGDEEPLADGLGRVFRAQSINAIHQGLGVTVATSYAKLTN